MPQPSDGKDAFRRVPICLGKDAFHRVPLFQPRGVRDAVERVLTKDSDAPFHASSVTDPLDVMHTPLERPVVWILHQVLSQGVFPNIGQLLLILDTIPHPMVERPARPFPCLVGVSPAELPLPERDPIIDAEPAIIGCTDRKST